MFGIHDLALYVLATVLLAVTPGPDTALVFAQSLRHGARGGITAACGTATGCVVHVTAASIGLSALLAASATAFNILKWAGAAYLLFIGVRTILTSGRTAPGAAAAPAPAARPFRWSSVYGTGFLTNVLNPKVAVFFVAFLPQFVSAGATGAPFGFAVLGLILIAVGFAWLAGVSLLASRSARMLGGRLTLRRWVERSLGVAFVVLAAKLALTERP
jgi:threonine/homoserine/homoserine lactone efflux protein